MQIFDFGTVDFNVSSSATSLQTNILNQAGNVLELSAFFEPYIGYGKCYTYVDNRANTNSNLDHHFIGFNLKGTDIQFGIGNRNIRQSYGNKYGMVTFFKDNSSPNNSLGEPYTFNPSKATYAETLNKMKQVEMLHSAYESVSSSAYSPLKIITTDNSVVIAIDGNFVGCVTENNKKYYVSLVDRNKINSIIYSPNYDGINVETKVFTSKDAIGVILNDTPEGSMYNTMPFSCRAVMLYDEDTKTFIPSTKVFYSSAPFPKNTPFNIIGSDGTIKSAIGIGGQYIFVE